jgi:hypothetical protein
LSGVNIAVIRRFEAASGRLSRKSVETDYKTYGIGSEITYVYVSADVTLSRTAKSMNDGEGRSKSFSGFNIPLETGWNLVQVDYYQTQTSASITIKTADKDVPWIWEEYDED